MSCYEYEYGTIKLPSKEFSRIRRLFAEKYNAWLDSNFLKATSLYEPLKAYALKNKKDKNLNLNDYIYEKLQSEQESDIEQIISSILNSKKVNGKYKTSIIKPTKKSFKHVSLSENNYEDLFATVSFNSETKEIRWQVEENNHSVDNAWENVLGKIFNKVISTVEWTRGTGGVFFYNSEYEREGREGDGAGGDRAHKYFGPAGEKHKEDRLKLLKLEMSFNKRIR